WWRNRIHDAAARRADIGSHTNAYRIVHGEADGCPSLICDRYDRYVVVQLMSAGIEAHRDCVIAAIEALPNVEGILDVRQRFDRGDDEVPMRLDAGAHELHD